MKNLTWMYFTAEKESFWPLKVQLTGSACEIQLDYVLGGSYMQKFTIEDKKILRKGGNKSLLNFDDLIDIPDLKWKKNFDPNVQLVYPQAYNITELVVKLINRQPIPEVCLSNLNRYIFR